MNGRNPEIRNQIQNEDPLILPTMPPASAKENARTRYAKGSDVAPGPDDAGDHGHDQGDREDRRDEPDDHAGQQLEGEDDRRGDDDPGDDALAEGADRGALLRSGSASGVVH